MALIMEECEGSVFDEIYSVKFRNPDTEARFKRICIIMHQLLEGLATLETSAITHRDIKSEKLLIGKDGNVEIADFGLSRPMPEDEVEDQKDDGNCWHA